MEWYVISMADFPGNFDRYLVGHLDRDLGALFYWH